MLFLQTKATENKKNQLDSNKVRNKHFLQSNIEENLLSWIIDYQRLPEIGLKKGANKSYK